MEPLKS